MANIKLSTDKLTGPQKAAIFLLTVGEEFTTTFFKNLDEKNIKKIGQHMAEINHIPSDVLNSVMDEFLTNVKGDRDIMISGENFLKQVVNKSLDKTTASEIFKVIGGEGGSVPFSDLAYMPADKLVDIIQGEHPQTIALVLSYLPHEKAAEVLKLISEEVKVDIALRIVKIGQVDIDVVNELDKVLKKEISKIGGSTKKIDGIEILANILNAVDGNTEELVLSHIEEEDDSLAEMVRQKMFVFEDLLQVENRNFRDILQNVDNQVLIKALKTTSEEMKNKIFSNLSERASEMLKEDMEVMGPVKLSEVEEAQQEIIKTAKRLESEGKIVLAKGSDDVFV
ncbi:MAG: flagellar motor switch protein FliG [Deltaproteobacteria bacterium]|nr:flagellar motor switch protein FliG [Deltaproteobacteria bacterium]